MKELRHLTALAALLLLAAPGYAQSIVRGRVTDARTGDPLPGTNVVVPGTMTGTATDVDGAYSLSVASLQDSLHFSFIGYLSQTVAIAGRTTVDVALAEDTGMLEDVIVVGYGTQERQSVTGAISTISSEDLAKTTSTTTSGALVGKVAGVLTRQPEGRPGSGVWINIRNLGSPLYVIDGIPKDEGQFNNIDFNDIDNITVLKDASAAAIYGVRGANGVVLVTTKRGRMGTENKVEVKSYYGASTLSRFPSGADAPTFIRAQIEADVNQNGTTGYTREDLEKWQQGTEYGYRGFDWRDFAMQSYAPKKYFQVSSTGGSDRSNYYVSLGRLSEEAVFEGYFFERTNLQANVDTRIGSRLKVGAQINGRVENRRNPGNPGFDDYWQPLFGMYRNLPTERPYANDNPKYPATTQNIASNHATLKYDITGYWRSTWRVAQTNLSAEYDLFKGLKARGIYSYYLADNVENTFEYTYDTYSYDRDTDTYYVSGGNQNPFRDRWSRKVEENMLQLQLNYDEQFGKHDVGVDLAFEATERQEPGYWLRASPSTNYINLLSFNELKESNDYLNESARQGYVGRFNYNYDDRYLLEVSGRYDASWQFVKDKRWGLFPSASVGWRLSNERFFYSLPVLRNLSNLKLRASIGQLGDDNIGVLGIGPFDYLSGYNYRRGTAVLNGQLVTGVEPRGLPITNLSWTKSTMTNLGVDFGLMNNKLSGTVEYFYRKRTGLPARRYDVLIPEEVAIYLPNENLNSDMHMGVEGSLGYTNRLSSGLQFSVSGNATFARMKDGEHYKPRFGNSWDEYRTSVEDRWAYLNWGYQVIGRFKDEDDIRNYPVDVDGQNNTTLLPGDFKFKDVNGDGIINGMDERVIGYRQGAIPNLNFGLNGSVAYKNVDLAFTFAGGGMGSYERNWEMKIPFQNNANSPNYIFEDRWHHEDPFDPESPWVAGKYPALRKGMVNHSNMRRSDFWITNVRYVALKTLEVGYTLPARLLNRFNIDRVRIYGSAYNLFSLDNLKEYGLSPEVAWDNGLQYPQMRTLTIGTTLGF